MKNLVLIFFIALTFLQCVSDGVKTGKKKPLSPSQRTEIGNFEYWHHIKNDGPKPLPGQVVFFNYRMRKGDKILQGNFGEDPSGGILPGEEEAKSNPQAIIEALRQMAVGDSITIIYPQGENPDSNLVYDVVLRAMYNK